MKSNRSSSSEIPFRILPFVNVASTSISFVPLSWNLAVRIGGSLIDNSLARVLGPDPVGILATFRFLVAVMMSGSSLRASG